MLNCYMLNRYMNNTSKKSQIRLNLDVDIQYF